jgi:hypothetical protein
MVKTRSVGAVLTLCLLTALGGTITLAQSDGSGQPGADPSSSQSAVSVSGTSSLVGEASPGTASLDGNIIRVRDNVLVTIEESSDPRVSGRATITVNFDAYPDQTGMPGSTQVRFGEARLENDEGSWSGRFAGSLANGGFVQTYWFEGDGAYEGLSYVVTAGGNGNVWRSQGLIFPGDIPPLGKGNTLPIDGLDLDLPTAFALAD